MLIKLFRKQVRLAMEVREPDNKWAQALITRPMGFNTIQVFIEMQEDH